MGEVLRTREKHERHMQAPLSEKPGWSDSSSAPASRVFVLKRSISEIFVGNHGTTVGGWSVHVTAVWRSSRRSPATSGSSGSPSQSTSNSRE